MTPDYIAECDRCGVIERGELEDVGDAVEDHEQFHDVQVKRVATDGGSNGTNQSEALSPAELSESFTGTSSPDPHRHPCGLPIGRIPPSETFSAAYTEPHDWQATANFFRSSPNDTRSFRIHALINIFDSFQDHPYNCSVDTNPERDSEIRTDGGFSQTENSSGNEGGSVSDLVPEEFDLHDALYKQKSTTPPSKRPRCPECGQLTVRTKTGKPTGRIKVESEYRCGQCLAHFDEPVYGDPSDIGGESP